MRRPRRARRRRPASLDQPQALFYDMIRYLRHLIPPAAKPTLRKWLGVPDLEVALGRLRAVGFRPKCIVDVGAFVGDWTLLSRQFFPEARVIMVEPQPDRAATLRALAARLPDVRFVP